MVSASEPNPLAQWERGGRDSGQKNNWYRYYGERKRTKIPSPNGRGVAAIAAGVRSNAISTLVKRQPTSCCVVSCVNVLDLP